MSRVVRVVHSSDLHVDDDNPADRHKGNEGLLAVLRTAVSLGADVLLLAGDTFDNPRVSLPTLRATAELLAGAPMPVVMLPGNHDPLLANCIFRRAGIPDLGHVHVLGIADPVAIVFPAFDLEVRGRAHVSFDDMDPLHPPHARRVGWQIVMAHGHYVPEDEWADQAHRSWKLSDAALAGTGADYVALGHWDRPTPAGDGRVKAYYSGSPDLARTVNLVVLGGDVVVERVALLAG